MSETVSYTQLHHDMGVVQARLDALEKAQEHSSETLREIRDGLAEIRGGRKTLGWIVAAAATIGGATSWIAKHVTFN